MAKGYLVSEAIESYSPAATVTEPKIPSENQLFAVHRQCLVRPSEGTKNGRNWLFPQPGGK